ncbi:MAG TPA: hypothetical protein VLA16_02990 [Ideonella sp.]|nr:hypothetical protein [Ideonella sp.]
MALPRIDAVLRSSPVQPTHPRESTPLLPPEPGSTLQLSLQQAAGKDLLAVGTDGLALRLPGLAHLADELAVGDTLMMRVVSVAPQLELALIEALGRTRAGLGGGLPASKWAEPPAMQFDQLAMRRMAGSVGSGPDANPPAIPLAATWRAQVLSLLLGPGAAAHEAPGPRRLLPAPTRNNHTGSAVVARDPQSPGPSLPALPLLPPPGTERWLFHTHTGLGLPVQLRLVEAEEDEPEAGAAPQADLSAGAMALRLTLTLPRLGRITLRLRSLHGGVALILVLARDSAVAAVRETLPGLALALVRAQIRLRSCRLLREPALSGDRVPPADLNPAHPRVAASLPPALFRAAAETVLALVAADEAAGP